MLSESDRLRHTSDFVLVLGPEEALQHAWRVEMCSSMNRYPHELDATIDDAWREQLAGGASALATDPHR